MSERVDEEAEATALRFWRKEMLWPCEVEEKLAAFLRVYENARGVRHENERAASSNIHQDWLDAMERILFVPPDTDRRTMKINTDTE